MIMMMMMMMMMIIIIIIIIIITSKVKHCNQKAHNKSQGQTVMEESSLLSK